jgi:exosome complex RNA-binding protein Rrp42 (RNase PH superfamily)
VLQVLVTTRLVCWPPASDGSVPAGALAVGKTQSGETLYMARVEHGGALTPGKVRTCCHVSFAQNECCQAEERVCIDLYIM